MPFPVQTLAKQLAAKGFKTKVELSEDDSVDDMIEITDLVHVQVGHDRSGGYAIVNAWTSPEMTAMQHYQTRRITDVAALVDDLRKALNQREEPVKASPYQKVIAETLKISAERAILVEAYLRLQYSTLSHLSRDDIRREYTRGGIGATIDADPAGAAALAKSYGF